jgi:hypothetical protein
MTDAGNGGGQASNYISPGHSDTLVHEEQEQLRKDFNKSGNVWTGLALSGGGVRSATFCLGALQALDNAGILDRFDYQSSVSGGGFTGLSWLWYRRQRPKWDFPFRENSAPLDFLRRNIGYLNPSSKIDYFSGAVAVLRTIFLNLLVWIPIITFMFCLIAWADLRWIDNGRSPVDPNSSMFSVYESFPVFSILGIAGLCLVALAAAFSIAASLALGRLADWLSQKTLLSKVIVPVIVLLASVSILYSCDLIKYDWPIISPTTSLDRAVLTVCILAVLVSFASVFIGRQREYSFLRALDEYSSVWAPLALALLLVGSTPLIAQQIWPNSAGSNAGIVAIASLSYGIFAAIYSHYVSFRSFAPGIAGRLLMMSGAALFLFGLFLLCFYLAERTVPLIEAWLQLCIDTRPLFKEFANLTDQLVYESIGLAALMIAGVALFYTNINQIGLHRYYRDRIAETFFAEQTSINNGVSGPTGEGISMTVEDLPRKQQGQSLERPYPIVNMNAIMVDDSDTKTRLRGGANFIASPLYSGSDATGWIKTSIFGEPNVGRPLHVATVTAASGAAVNSSAGYAGTGITRNRIVSIAMRLLNVRLGFWLINPHWLNKKSGGALRWITKTAPTHFRPGLVHLLSNNWKRTAKFVELSDGGHFDNLGVYELLRRRCDLILVCDGEADKETSYGGLVSVARRAKEDFGAELHFEPGLGPERMVANLPLGYPSNAKAAASPYMAARVSYPKSSLGGAKDGIIIYVKATMIDDVSFVTKGYKGNNPDFPHQSTVDQFFQAEQFEAYRELGEVAATKCIREMKIDVRFDNPFEMWPDYLHDNRRSHNK